MRKVVLYKKKKRIVGHKVQVFRRLVAVAAVSAGILFGTSLLPATRVQAADSTASVSCDIYHTHTGSSSSGGGCYGKAVYHVHTGSSTGGGACYQTKVYHTHTGNTSALGGCYGKAVYHTHSGNAQSGGACYSPVYHSHTGSCKETRTCNMTYEISAITETWQQYCYHHQETTHGSATATITHSRCGAGKVSSNISYCIACGPYPISHEYEVFVCGLKESSVTGYQLSCGKTTSTVESYALNCGKGTSTVDSYKLSCSKTAQTVDSYQRDCGLAENTPVARLVLKNETAGTGQTVKLSAKIEDLTGGKLNLSGGGYTWYDENGNVLSQQSTVQVKKNTTYRVVFTPPAVDGKLSGLTGSITVKNVYVPTPTPTATPTAKPTATPTARPTATPTVRPTAAPTAKPTARPTAAPTLRPTAKPTAKPTVKPTVKPTAVPAVTPEGNSAAGSAASGNISDNTQGYPEENTRSDSGSGELLQTKPTATPTIVPVPTPTQTPLSGPAMIMQNVQEAGEKLVLAISEEMMEEAKVSPSPESILSKETVDVEEDKEIVAETENEVLGEERKDAQKDGKSKFSDFMNKPVVRVLSITTGTFLSAGLLALLFFFIRRTVAVYNDDGTGQMIYLGRCIVTDEADDFSIVITPEMVEKACTNRYCIRPGLFLIGRNEAQEMFVNKGKKRIGVYLSKEMIVVL